MKLTIVFGASGPVRLPVDYSYLVQGMIYRHMENEGLREYVHEEGFTFRKRRFKLFAFSRLMSRSTRFDAKTRTLELAPPLQLVICSPIVPILESLATGFLKRGFVCVGDARFTVERAHTESPRVERDEVTVQMLSPLVVYSTLRDAGGRKYTYYSPYEPQFTEILQANLKKKLLLISGRVPEPRPFCVRPLGVHARHQKVTRYKDTIVKGWMGDYVLEGDPALL